MSSHLSGFFSMASSTYKPWTAALRVGRAFLTPTAPGLVHPPSCAGAGAAQADLACWFEPLGPPCERRGGAPQLRFNLMQLQRESLHLHGGAAIPEPFRPLGAFWWASQLLARLLTPAPPLAALVDRALAESGLGAALAAGGVIGLHVRHGDACIESELSRTARACDPLARYVDALLPYARRHNIRTIFVATDSAPVLRDAAGYKELTFLHLRNVTRAAATPAVILDEVLKSRVGLGGRRRQYGGVDRTHAAALAGIVDTLLLARCDVLVGKFSSGLFRAAYQLAVAQKGALPPYLSLDAPWCAEYGIAAGYNEDYPKHRGGGHHGTEQVRVPGEAVAGRSGHKDYNLNRFFC